MGPPHDPYGAPEKYARLYDPATLTMRPNWVEGTPGGGRKEIAAYYAAITAVDDQVGRLLDELKRLNLENDTVVVFTSDHGDMLGSHGLRLKRKPWEESIRVPGIVRYPATMAPGRVSDALVTHVDLAPTLLSLCGFAVPEAMQGSDLAPLFLGKTDRGPDSAFFQIFVPFAGDVTPRPWRGVRTATHMYARTQAGPWLLYSLKDDPSERKNLADDPASIPLRDRMDARLADWMTRTGDSWAFNSEAKVEDNGRLYRFGAFTSIADYETWAAAHPELAPKD